MSWLMFELKGEGNDENVVDAPSEALQEKLVRSNYVESKGVSIETFQPVSILSEDGTGDKLLIYKRIDIPKHSVKRDENGQVSAADTLLSGLSKIGIFTHLCSHFIRLHLSTP